MNNVLRLGTRGSPLARTQTRMVQELLLRHRPDVTVETVIIKTTGDLWAAQSAATEMPGDKGLFTKELEEALLNGSVDVAIHSLKDLPVEFHPELMLAAVLPRANPQDVLISRETFPGWAQLPLEATLATGSLRRGAQLRVVRPDLQLVDIRGNIDTRLRKLRENPAWYGIILASAGLDRLAPDVSGLTVTPIALEVMLPAPGQGAVALEGRRQDDRTQKVLQSLHCAATLSQVQAERAFLQGLGGGCRAPVGAYASLAGDELQLQGVYFPDPLGPAQKGMIQGRIGEGEQLGRQLAAQLLPT
jgi:hydroxymethylbilane synthase